MRFLGIAGRLEQAVFREIPHLTSVLWAVTHFGLGLLLWQADMFLVEPMVDKQWLLVTLALVCVAIAFRRILPGVAVAVGGVAVAVDVVLGASLWILIALGDLLYASMVWGGRRLAHTMLGMTAVGHVLLFALFLYALSHGLFARGVAELVQLTALCLMVFLTPVLTGMTVREHREKARIDRERAERAERLAELDRAKAVAVERGRMARELHDVVANHLSAVAIQSTAALAARELDPVKARRVLEVVRDSSVQGLDEMRRMIHLLRSDTDSADSDMTLPGLGGVDLLLSRARQAGLEVGFTEHGESVPLPAKVDAAAYRILQEALTNALRYASPPRADVLIVHPRAEFPSLSLEVVNPAAESGSPWDSGLGSSMGLTGMRERALLLGGELEASPVSGGRWRVRVLLPVGETPDTEKITAEEIER